MLQKTPQLRAASTSMDAEVALFRYKVTEYIHREGLAREEMSQEGERGGECRARVNQTNHSLLHSPLTSVRGGDIFVDLIITFEVIVR